MIVALLLFVVGVLLSAFYSGSETGFYRVTRARLVIAALRGDWLSRVLLWAASNPSMFVATALVGNNVANYVCSAAIVMGAGRLMPGTPSAEFVAPMLLAPLIFVYGELLPKSLFFRAPNRLLRRGAPGLVVSGVVFAPVIGVLWLFSRLLELVGRRSPPEIRMVLARRELGQLLDEGHAEGLIQPVQQSIAQAALTLGGKPVKNFMTPAGRMPRVKQNQTVGDALRLARRHRQALLPVEQDKNSNNLVGFVRAADCAVADGKSPLPVQTMLSVSENDSYLATLSRMIATGQDIARVMNLNGQTTGFVTLEHLQRAILSQ